LPSVRTADLTPVTEAKFWFPAAAGMKMDRSIFEHGKTYIIQRSLQHRSLGYNLASVGETRLVLLPAVADNQARWNAVIPGQAKRLQTRLARLFHRSFETRSAAWCRTSPWAFPPLVSKT